MAVDGLGARVRRLLTPEAGLLGQGVRFVAVGCATAVVYLASTTVLALVVGLPFEVALAIGFCLTISFNFTMQRTFVWVHREGFRLPLRRQFGRYIAITGTQYAITATSTAVLPRALGLSTEVVYLVVSTGLAAFNFFVYRYGVFHADRVGGAARTSSPADIRWPGVADAPTSEDAVSDTQSAQAL